MSGRTPLLALAGALAAIAISACGLVGTAERGTTSTTAGATGTAGRGTRTAGRGSGSTGTASPPAPAGPAGRSHELPTPSRSPAVAGGWRSPAGAARAFAAVYVNWTAATAADRLRGLARVSVGQARAEMVRAAAQTAADSELRRSGVANAGRVEAVGRLAGPGLRYAVVTRERTSSSRDPAYRGLRPAWHVAVATVTRVGDLWVLSRWQPEN